VMALLYLVQLFAHAADVMKRSAFARLHLELAIVKAASRGEIAPLDELIQQVTQAVPPAAHAAGAPPTTEASRPSAVDAPAPVPPADAAGAWSALLQAVGAEKVSLAAYLSEAQLLGCEQGVARIGLPPSALHRETLETLEHRRLIERAAREVWRQPALTIQYVTLSAAPSVATALPAAAPAGAPVILQRAMHLFDAKVIPDRPAPGGSRG